MSGLGLVDKSAFWQVDAESSEHELCLCPVIRMEILYSARSLVDYEAVETGLGSFRELRMDAETFAGAATAQRELARLGEHRVPIPDVLIAACAQQHGADVLHRDRHFETLASVLSFRPVRVD